MPEHHLFKQTPQRPCGGPSVVEAGNNQTFAHPSIGHDTSNHLTTIHSSSLSWSKDQFDVTFWAELSSSMLYSPNESLSADTEDTWCKEYSPSPEWRDRTVSCGFCICAVRWTSGTRGRKEENLPHYVVSETFPLLLSEGLTEALDQFVQLLCVVSQELPYIFQILQVGWVRWAEITKTQVHLYGPGDAQNVVALLLVIVESLIKQDGDRSQSRKTGSQ